MRHDNPDAMNGFVFDGSQSRRIIKTLELRMY